MVKKYLAIISLVVFGLIGFTVAWQMRPLPFDSSLWKEARDQGDRRTCYRMRESLKTYIEGNSIEYDEIRSILGEPDRFWEDKGVSYDLGHHFYWGSTVGDKFWITIGFGSNPGVSIHPD